MKALKAVLAVLIALVTSWCIYELTHDWSYNEPDYIIRTPDAYDPSTKENIWKTFLILTQECDGLAHYWNSFEKVTAHYGPVAVPERETDYGWQHEITYEFLVKADPQDELRQADAAGKTFSLYAGGGTKPGIIGRESVAKYLCSFAGASLEKGADEWLAMDRLAFLGK